MAKFIVTGSEGLIGTNLCNRLSNLVIRIDNLMLYNYIKKDDNSFILLNIANLVNPSTLKEIVQKIKQLQDGEEIEGIYHLAGIAVPTLFPDNREKIIEETIQGVYGILNLCKELGCKKIVYASSSEVYGSKQTQMSEKDAIYLDSNYIRNAYSISKLMAENILLTNRDNIQVKCARIFNTYGIPFHFYDTRIIPKLLKQYIKVDDHLKVNFNGKHIRSFSYVEDTITALIYLMNSNSYGIFNVGNSTETYTILDIIKIFENIFQININYTLSLDVENHIKGETSKRIPNIKKLESLTGFKPSISLTTGLYQIKQMIDTEISTIKRF